MEFADLQDKVFPKYAESISYFWRAKTPCKKVWHKQKREQSQSATALSKTSLNHFYFLAFTPHNFVWLLLFIFICWLFYALCFNCLVEIVLIPRWLLCTGGRNVKYVEMSVAASHCVHWLFMDEQFCLSSLSDLTVSELNPSCSPIKD